MKSNKKNKAQKKLPGDNSASQIPWHPAFVEALQLELEAYKDVLEFHPELQLTTEPLRIDCVVIKKKKEVKIKKNIGAIFRTWNLLEYKSPDDYVSVMDFYKVYGYACIYTFLNEIPITDLTITFVESHHPRELLKHLETVRGYTVAKTSAGVYNVKGDIFPIQIIDSRELSAEDCVWLRNLGNKLNRSDIELISIKIAQQGKSARIDAYAYAIAHGNSRILEDRYMTRKAPVDHEKRMEQFLRRAGLIDKWQADAESRVNKKWMSVVAEKDSKLADSNAEIERLRLQVAELTKK